MAPLPVFRLDADAVAGGGRRRDAGARSMPRRAGVLVGTQMVAKGHDFPDVTLGVVLDADATLRFPDFRAEERTFALVAQLAGRSGRGPRGGAVVVQALDPRGPRAAPRGRARRRGLPRRRAGAPRAAQLPALRQPDPGRLLGRAGRARAERRRRPCATAIDHPADVLGPAPLFRLKGRERIQLVVKSERPRRGDRRGRRGGRGGGRRALAGRRELGRRRRPAVGEPRARRT